MNWKASIDTRKALAWIAPRRLRTNFQQGLAQLTFTGVGHGVA
jgi:hypothetical protein